MKTYLQKAFWVQLILWMSINNTELYAQAYQFVREISGYSQNPPLARPISIDITSDTQGNVYLLDDSRSQVVVSDASGQCLRRWKIDIGLNGTLKFITSDSQNNVYVTGKGTAGDIVLKYSSIGQLLTTWGGTGTSNGKFNVIKDIAVNDLGEIYVVDVGRIQKFTSSGGFVMSWGSTGTANGQFTNLRKIDFDSEGNVYAVETNRIQKFTPNGVYITSWIVFNTGDAQFYDINGISIDRSTNEVYVLQSSSIYKFSNTGTPLLKWIVPPPYTSSLSLYLDNFSKNIFEIDFSQSSTIKKFNTQGIFINNLTLESGDAQLIDILGSVAIDNNGYTYVSDWYGNGVKKFDANGIYVNKIGSVGYGDGQFNHPNSNAADFQGNLYVVDVGNNRIQKFSSTGIFIAKWGSLGSGNGLFNNPNGIAIDATSIYISDKNNNRIQKFTLDGVFITAWGVSGAGNGQFSGISGIAVDKSGNVYVADAGNNRIQKFTASGTFISSWGIYGTTDGRFNNPRGVAVNESGEVFVADFNNYRIQKFSSSGTFLLKWGSKGTNDGQFKSISGISVDKEGKVYITDAERVQVFAPPVSILVSVNAAAPYCQGQSITINYTTLSPFNVGNLFIAQLSNASGTFESGTTSIGSISANGSGTISAIIPTAAIPSGLYRIRIISTDATSVSEDNGANITINAKPVKPVISGITSVCTNQDSVLYSVANTVGSTYNWTAPVDAVIKGGTNSSITIHYAVSGGTITVKETTNTGCTSDSTSLPITMNSLPNNLLALRAPAIACPQETSLVFTVTNATAGSQYNWTLPIGATIVTGVSTSQITVKWGNTTGVVGVTETNGCATGLATEKTVAVSSYYALGNVNVICGSSFSVPLQTIGDIKNGLIGLDYVINYDPALFTPSTVASVGSVATSYGDYSLNTATTGKVFVSVFLKNAPFNTFFNGSGTVLYVNFTAKTIGVTTGTLTTDEIEESTLLGAAKVCPAVPASLSSTTVLGGRIIYGANVNNTLAYNPALPASLIPTEVTGYGTNCTLISGSETLPNTLGVFGFNPDSGPLLRLQREVKGDRSVSPLECSNVQEVINSIDCIQTAAIANYSNATPTIYQLLSADVNLDGKVTAGDVSLISSRSVNSNNCEFPQGWNYEWNGSAYVPNANYAASLDWLFLDDATLATPAFTSGFGRNQVPAVPICLAAPAGAPFCTPVVTATYHAILLGDVNGNWVRSLNGALLRQTKDDLIFDLPNALNTGSSTIISVYYSGEEFTGADFSLDYENLDIVGVTGATGVNTVWNDIEQTRLMVTASSAGELSINDPVMFIEVSSEEKVSSRQIKSSEGYLNGEAANMKFGFAVSNNMSSGIAVNIFPNPSDAETYLYVEDEATAVKLNIYDTKGVLVYENRTFESNVNVVLPKLEAGVYIVKVSGSGGEITKKMVRY